MLGKQEGLTALITISYECVHVLYVLVGTHCEENYQYNKTLFFFYLISEAVKTSAPLEVMTRHYITCHCNQRKI